jgi:hypothetical protein
VASQETAEDCGAPEWWFPTNGRVPYIAAWTGEEELPTMVINDGLTRIGFADEVLTDRDDRDVLWTRIPSRPGQGRPQFGQVHALRQRRAMRRLLCQVCAKPADRSEHGVLFLLPDHRDDWANWPEGMANTYPPLCLPCARLSVGVCPMLRRGFVAVRARRCPLSGVRGLRYLPARPFPVPVQGIVVGYDDPDIRWTCAVQQVRSLEDCTIVSLDGGE